ncbi:hypothetical protein ADM99_16490 [Leptolinea tardivitalis]|uniref:Uncharacterized protein n=1 Tax=Leptolinea tardivitalis TaxID=229920 RepID=A0A0N8GKU6_9CHLR|nr:hypothetical protein ADM99_16490 [Leptolinea tardivitalis]
MQPANNSIHGIGFSQITCHLKIDDFIPEYSFAHYKDIDQKTENSIESVNQLQGFLLKSLLGCIGTFFDLEIITLTL